MSKKLKTIISAVIMLAMFTALSGCSKKAKGMEINMAVLKGPTGIGAVKLMEDSAENKTVNTYNFTVATSADEVVSKVISGEVDIAAVPTNLAATLYNKTEGEVRIAAINTLGNISIISSGPTDVFYLQKLSGHTIYVSGQSSVPEYALKFILDQQEVKDVTIEYKSEHAELAAGLISGEVEFGMLPEPYVTTVLANSTGASEIITIDTEWNDACKGTEYEGTALAIGCIIVRKDFVENNKASFDAFLEEYAASINYVKENVPDAAVLVEKYELMASAELAEEAIPYCNITYIDGEEMRSSISKFFQVLFDANPSSIGGKLPDEEFYYKK